MKLRRVKVAIKVVKAAVFNMVIVEGAVPVAYLSFS